MSLDDRNCHLMYVMLKQKCSREINWDMVADELRLLGHVISNGHACRMRWSRFKRQMEGPNSSAPKRSRASRSKVEKIKASKKKSSTLGSEYIKDDVVGPDGMRNSPDTATSATTVGFSPSYEDREHPMFATTPAAKSEPAASSFSSSLLTPPPGSPAGFGEHEPNFRPTQTPMAEATTPGGSVQSTSYISCPVTPTPRARNLVMTSRPLPMDDVAFHSFDSTHDPSLDLLNTFEYNHLGGGMTSSLSMMNPNGHEQRLHSGGLAGGMRFDEETTRWNTQSPSLSYSGLTYASRPGASNMHPNHHSFPGATTGSHGIAMNREKQATSERQRDFGAGSSLWDEYMVKD